MATQITHIALADKVFENYFPYLDKKDFYVGTVFPDIRYLGDISRDETHLYDLCLSDIVAEKSSFEAGRKFHCLVDLVREDFLERSGLYQLYADVKDKYSVPKFLEDELLYPLVLDWGEVITYFDKLLPEELSYALPISSIERWHANLQDYFSSSPSDASRSRHGIGLRFTEDRINELNRNLASLRENQEIVKVLNSFYENLEASLEGWKS